MGNDTLGLLSQLIFCYQLLYVRMNINDLPLDCLQLIAKLSIPCYLSLLTVRKFALSTLPTKDDPNANLRFRNHFTTICTNEIRRYYFLNGRYHRDDDQPAIIFADGDKYWYRYGKIHRDGDKPAIELARGELKWFQNGQLHRHDDKPAVITADQQEWYYWGVLHRDNDMPAVVGVGFKRWYKRGKLHRDGDKPASIYRNNNYLWYQDGQCHRDHDRPAIIYDDGSMRWYKHDRLHRIGGPAVINDDYTTQWFINGKKVDESYN
jgi:hypothetical protein